MEYEEIFLEGKVIKWMRNLIVIFFRMKFLIFWVWGWWVGL